MGGSASQSTPSRPQPSYAKSRDAETFRWIAEHPWATGQSMKQQFGQHVPTYDWNKGKLNIGTMYDQGRADKYGQLFGNWGHFARPEGGIDYGILNNTRGYVQGDMSQSIVNNDYTRASRYNQMAKDLMNPDLGYSPKNPYNTMIGLDIMEKGIPDPGQRPVSQMFGTGNWAGIDIEQTTKDMFTYMPGVGGL